MARNTIWPGFPMLHQALPPPRWTNLLFIKLVCVSTVHVHRMGTWNVPTQPLLIEIWGGRVGFGWFWSWGTLDSRLARQKLGKNTPQSWRPSLPYVRHGAFPPAPLHTTISQHAVRQVYVIKLENIIVFTMYLLAILRHDASSTCRAWVFAGCMALRVSYSQRAALRL